MQLKSLIEASQRYYLRDRMDIEYEILLIWSTFLPLVINPIVYFLLLSETRRGALKGVKFILGCQDNNEKEEKEEVTLNEKEGEGDVSGSKTQVTDML